MSEVVIDLGGTRQATGSPEPPPQPRPEAPAEIRSTGKRIVVTGSVAYDYLMTFPGRFVEVVVPDRLHRLSVSFLVDEMRRVRGGVAANIAYTLAILGGPATIMATAGSDAADYKRFLADAGIDVSALRLCDDVFTASFFVSTDLDQNQIATFYAGAMARARDLSFRDLDPATIALAVIAPNDPVAMNVYAQECRELGIPFVYDPSQQVARLSGADLLTGLEGAEILIGNEYEYGIVEKKTGLTETEILARVPVVIQTQGEEGSLIALRGGTADNPDGTRAIRIPPARLRSTALDPTGVGDAYRGGILAARAKGLPWELAGRVGSVAAAYALEAIGPHPKPYSTSDLLERYEESYGTGDGFLSLVATFAG